MKQVTVGCITYPSFAAACKARKVNYFTAYMRVKQLGWSVSKALGASVAERKERVKKEDTSLNMTQNIMLNVHEYHLEHTPVG